MHRHLVFLYLSQIHDLVYEIQNAFRITFYSGIESDSLWIFVALEERHDWGDDECHRSSNLMTDVHKVLDF